MTTNLFIIVNVKQLRTGGSFRILLPFSDHLGGVGVLNWAIFNSFHIRVEFGTILEGLRKFGGGGERGEFEHPQTPPRYATDHRLICTRTINKDMHQLQFIIRVLQIPCHEPAVTSPLLTPRNKTYGVILTKWVAIMQSNLCTWVQ